MGNGTAFLQGLLGGVGGAVGGGVSNYYTARDKAAEMAAMAEERRQRQKNWEAEQKDREALRLQQADLAEKDIIAKGMLAGAPEGYYKAMSPATKEQMSQYEQDKAARDAEVRRRYEAAQSYANAPTVVPLNVKRTAGDYSADDLDVANAKMKFADQVSGEAIQDASPDLPAARDAARAAVQAEAKRREIEAERSISYPSATEVDQMRSQKAPLTETPLADVEKPTMSPRAMAAVGAGQAISKAKADEKKAKEEAEFKKEQMKKEMDIAKQREMDDAAWNRKVREGKDKISASYVSGVGKEKAVEKFKTDMAREYAEQHPEFHVVDPKTGKKTLKIAAAMSKLDQLEKYPPVGASPEAMDFKEAMKEVDAANAELKAAQDAAKGYSPKIGGKLGVADPNIRVNAAKDRLATAQARAQSLSSGTGKTVTLSDDERAKRMMSPADYAEWKAANANQP